MTKLNSYKVEFEEVVTYVVDVQAITEDEARAKAINLFDEKKEMGIEHYYVTGDTRTDFGTVYDVTNTDDDIFLSTN